MEHKYTVDEIMTFKPCYSIDKVAEIIGDGKTAHEISNMEIPHDDKIWCLLQIVNSIGGCDLLEKFARGCALAAYRFSHSNYNNDIDEACQCVSASIAADEAAWLAYTTPDRDIVTREDLEELRVISRFIREDLMLANEYYEKLVKNSSEEEDLHSFPVGELCVEERRRQLNHLAVIIVFNEVR